MKTLQKLTLATLLFGSSILLTSCIGNNICISPQGGQTSETKNFGEIKELNHNFSGDVTIYIQKNLTNPYAVISGSKNLVNNLEIKERGDKLIIDEDRCIKNNSDVHIELYVSELNEIDLNGSGSIYSLDTISSNLFKVEINGSGDIEISTKANTVDVELNGSGEIVLAGETNLLRSDLQGSGTIDGYDLIATEANLDISGSGTIKANVTDKLKAEISGSGSIYYIGNPSVTSNITGSGSINKF